MAKKKEEVVEQEVSNVEVVAKAAPAEKMFTGDQVKALIADVLREHDANKGKPVSPKKVFKHNYQVSRFKDSNDGNKSKWVVGFVDSNTDPYINHPVYSVQKFNANKRENEAFVTLKFNDGATLEVPLKYYIMHRTQLFMPAKSKEIVDKSYSHGEVPMTQEVGDKYVPTGKMMEQLVDIQETLFTFELDGQEYVIPEYALA